MKKRLIKLLLMLSRFLSLHMRWFYFVFFRIDKKENGNGHYYKGNAFLYNLFHTVKQIHYHMLVWLFGHVILSCLRWLRVAVHQESGKFSFYFLCASSFETSSVFKNSLLSINGITKRLSDLNGVRNENFNHGSHKSGWEERGVGRNGEWQHSTRVQDR